VHRDDHTQFVPVYEEDGVTPNPDAVYLPNAPRPKAKFEEEARGLFGVAMIKDPETGEFIGRKARPFNYSCCTVVGGERYLSLCENRFLEIQAPPLPPSPSSLHPMHARVKIFSANTIGGVMQK
jgi:hypothetical protein